MKIKEKKLIPEKEVEVVVAVKCDLCSKEFRTSNWGGSSFDIERTSVSYESGQVYPEGGSTELISYDICPKCFMNKLVPWLESQGAEYTLKDNDY